MSLVKMPYYPQILVTQRKTRFGVSEIQPQDLYENPITGKYIVRVDLLYSLQDLWGSKWLSARNMTYELISGNRDDNACARLLASYYRKYAEVAEHINNLDAFVGDAEASLSQLVLEEAVKTVKNYELESSLYLSNRGGKYLVSTHAYLYFAFRSNPSAILDNLEGAVLIC